MATNTLINNLKILYWNVWCFPKCYTDGKLTAKERAKALSQYIVGYDLVLLNEAWETEAKDVFKKLYPYYYTDKNYKGKVYGTGLMVLSQYPIMNASYENYKHSAGWDWFANKGVIYFQIQVNGKTLDFYTTHMQAGNSDADQNARLQQSLQLSNFINKTSGTSTSKDVWLIGDFNMMPTPPPPYPNNVRTKSFHCKDINDNILRETSYNMILKETQMNDVLKNYDVYRVLTKRTDNKTTAQYMDSHGLTDGSYLVIEFPI